MSRQNKGARRYNSGSEAPPVCVPKGAYPLAGECAGCARPAVWMWNGPADTRIVRHQYTAGAPDCHLPPAPPVDAASYQHRPKPAVTPRIDAATVALRGAVAGFLASADRPQTTQQVADACERDDSEYGAAYRQLLWLERRGQVCRVGYAHTRAVLWRAAVSTPDTGEVA